jgi:hypothetical protein
MIVIIKNMCTTNSDNDFFFKIYFFNLNIYIYLYIIFSDKENTTYDLAYSVQK